MLISATVLSHAVQRTNYQKPRELHKGWGTEKRATVQTAVKSAEGPKVNMATESFQVKPVTVISNINLVN